MYKLALFVWVVMGLAQAQQAPQTPEPQQFDPPSRLEPIERFAGPLVVRTAAGATRSVHVVIRTWSIPNRQRVQLPDRGYRVVQLVSGDAATVIAGDRRRRREGEFWTVAAGQDLIVETARDTVTLSVVSIEE